ncbi:MAG TPA: DUF1800 domain-containing protein [Candidatus Dormibacteraeota bacterium]|nr:DUF1800 domain-containing protein [Candidatus Dormibacteraeota bacterium]
MDDAPVVMSPAPSRKPIWKRPVSRRTVLATGAAGATAAALAVLWKGNDLSQILDRVRDITHGYPGALSNERTRVAHLLRRAGFGVTPGELDRYVAMGTTDATKTVLNNQTVSNAKLESELPAIDVTGVQNAASIATIQAWWLQRMAQTARPLEEKMTLFWHGLLTSGLDKAGPAQMFVQNQLYRKMALANFDELLKAVSKDPAMMVYLDTETNRKGKPNENYARELMELFTTGIGHYTENDVQESARAFTGWTLRGGKQLRYATDSVFVARLHDNGSKTFMGKTGNFTGDDIVEMLVPLRATAERLSSRLFAFFAYQNPEAEIVQHLADVFQKSRYNVGAVVAEIFGMDAFYSEKAYRALVKSPAELVAQTIKATGADAKAYTQAAAAMAPMGQVLFYPPNVAGWPAGTSWINSTTLLARINFANAATQRMRASLPSLTADQLMSTLVDGNVTSATANGIHDYLQQHPDDQAGLQFMVMATPEFQLN